MVYTQIFQRCKGNVILDNTIHIYTQIQPKKYIEMNYHFKQINTNKYL